MAKKSTKRQEVDYDLLFYLWDDIAISIGMPPSWERDWTDEDWKRLFAEVERPGFMYPLACEHPQTSAPAQR